MEYCNEARVILKLKIRKKTRENPRFLHPLRNWGKAAKRVLVSTAVSSYVEVACDFNGKWG